MKVNKFKIGDKVRVNKSGANASQFNSDRNILGVYAYPDWEDKVFVIEGTIKLTDFKNEESASSAHLLKNLDGTIAGYVYSYALIPAKVEWSFSLTTNVIWFGRDNGRVEASTYEEAKRLAKGTIVARVEQMNEKLGTLDRIDVNLDEIKVERIK